MTNNRYKSKDNDAIFEAYATQQLDERGGLFDKGLSKFGLTKNIRAGAQGRVDAKQTAKQVTQAFYQSLGRNKGQIDSNQFKAWVGQAVGVNPQFLQSVNSISKPTMSHGEIKKMLPDIVDQAITAKQSGQAASPGAAAQSANVASPVGGAGAAAGGAGGNQAPNPNVAATTTATGGNTNAATSQVAPPAGGGGSAAGGSQTQVAPPVGTTDTTNNPNTPERPGLMSRVASGLASGAKAVGNAAVKTAGGVGTGIGAAAGGLVGGAVGGYMAGKNKANPSEEPAATQEPEAENPAAEEPEATAPATEEPAAAVEEPAAQEPAAEEPAAAVEEPAAQEPAVEPAAEPAPAPAVEPAAEEPAGPDPDAQEPVPEPEGPAQAGLSEDPKNAIRRVRRALSGGKQPRADDLAALQAGGYTQRQQITYTDPQTGQKVSRQLRSLMGRQNLREFNNILGGCGFMSNRWGNFS